MGRGKSLYSKGTFSDRRNFGEYSYLDNFLQDTDLKSSSEEDTISNFLNQSPKTSKFSPVEGSTKSFPPFLSKNASDSFSQRLEPAKRAENAWTPSLLKPVGKERVGREESDKEQEVKLTAPGTRVSAQLTHFKELLRRQKKIKQQVLDSLRRAKERKSVALNSMMLENGEPSDEDVTEYLVRNDDEMESSNIIEKPFLDEYDIEVGSDLEIKQRQRRKNQEDEFPVISTSSSLSSIDEDINETEKTADFMEFLEDIDEADNIDKMDDMTGLRIDW